MTLDKEAYEQRGQWIALQNGAYCKIVNDFVILRVSAIGNNYAGAIATLPSDAIPAFDNFQAVLSSSGSGRTWEIQVYSGGAISSVEYGVTAGTTTTVVFYKGT